MAPTVTGSKACWAPQTRCKAFMGWSWAAAFSVRGRGHIVRPRAQLVIIIIIIIERMLWVMCSGSARQDATDDDTDEGCDATVCSAGNVQVVTVACAANSLIDLMMGDLETFLIH